MKKKMIILEGIAGAGKTTNINMFMEREKNIDGLNIKMSKLMENIEKTNYIDYTNTEYFLLLENLKTILYKDSKKDIVLFERYYLSSLAHSYAMKILEQNNRLYQRVFNWYKDNIGTTILKPDAYIFLEIPIEISMERIKTRNEKVVNSIWRKKEYMELCEKYKRNFVKEYENDVNVYKIDATMNIEDVYNKIKKIIINL